MLETDIVAHQKQRVTADSGVHASSCVNLAFAVGAFFAAASWAALNQNDYLEGHGA